MFSKKNIGIYLLLSLIITACENDIKVINNLSSKKHTPVESATNVETTYSDSGRVAVIVKAPLLNRYEEENPYTEMPNGIAVNFYDTSGQIKSHLTANYAISYPNKKIMEAKNNVVVVNEKGEKLNTEHLVWDQTRARIYSDKYVTVNTGKEVLYGTGLDADERFDHWVITKPKGSFTVKED